jgi:hypothetical protein
MIIFNPVYSKHIENRPNSAHSFLLSVRKYDVDDVCGDQAAA